MIAFLGAEKQAATSAALAYREIEFTFVSDQPVIDAWDLPNVRCVSSTPEQIPTFARSWSGPVIPLCARWIDAALPAPRNRLGTFKLSSVLAELSAAFAAHVMPVSSTPAATGPWIVKGDLRHRPDAVVAGGPTEVTATEDPHRCGVVFQAYLASAEPFLVTGFRADSRGADIAVFRIHGEVHCRENLLTAAETVDVPVLTELSLAMLERLAHCGWFSMKWLRASGEYRLASLRPIPMATLQTMRRAGLDPLMRRPASVTVARAGYRLIADNWYTSYEALA